MQVDETLNEGLKRALQVTVPAADLDGRLTLKLDQLKNTVQLKGFRPGKVPAAHIRKLYGKQIMAEVVQEVIDDTSAKALEERGERPAFQPKVEFVDEEKVLEKVLAGNHDLAYKMEFEIMPAIEMADVSQISIERPVIEASDKEIDATLTQIAEDERAYHARDADAPAENGDRVVFSYEGKIDGKPFAHGAADDATFILGTGYFIEGFDEAIVGKKTGDEFSVDVTFPQDYPAKELCGKAAVFDITLKEVAAPGEIEINDELAKKLGLSSLADLRQAIMQEYEEQNSLLVRQYTKRLLLDELDKLHVFALPPTLVQEEFDSMWEQMADEMEQAEETFEDSDTTEEEAREEYQKIAERRVRLGLVLGEIGTKNNITVSKDELQKAIMDRITRFPGQEQRLIDFYKNTPHATAALHAPLFEEKVVNYLLELVTVTDKMVTREELETLFDELSSE